MLELKNISKSYIQNGQHVEAVKDFDLSVDEHEFIALVGPSGCGKTTLLKLIAGLLPISAGAMSLEGNKITGPGKDRGMVFQSFTLFPWLTVRGNIGFGLELQGMEEAEKTKIVDKYLNVTGLTEFADFYPKNLSGGMQQRVAIARTLANNPKILLMDEPFGALDAQTRSQMQEFLTKVWEMEHKTIVFITHDVSEAIFLADKVYVLSKRPMQVKKIVEIPFARPRTHALKRSKEFFEIESAVAQILERS